MTSSHHNIQDCLIYFIHVGLHLPVIYPALHKLHHKWKVPSPFASHAFHPIDGFMQSLPYHIYPFLFPLHKGLYLGLFIFVNFWTVSIHDAYFCVPNIFKPYINGAAHHTDHHLYFTVNYGEFFTFWDRVGRSFKDPTAYNGDDVHDQVPKDKAPAVESSPSSHEDSKDSGSEPEHGASRKSPRKHVPVKYSK